MPSSSSPAARSASILGFLSSGQRFADSRHRHSSDSAVMELLVAGPYGPVGQPEHAQHALRHAREANR